MPRHASHSVPRGKSPSGVFGTLPLPRSSVLFHELASAVKRAQLTAGTQHVEAVSDGAGLRSERCRKAAQEKSEAGLKGCRITAWIRFCGSGP